MNPAPSNSVSRHSARPPPADDSKKIGPVVHHSTATATSGAAPVATQNSVPRAPAHLLPTTIAPATCSDAMAATLSRPSFSLAGLPSFPSGPSLLNSGSIPQMSPRIPPRSSFSSSNAPIIHPASPTSSYSSSASFSRGLSRLDRDSGGAELPPIRPYRSDSNRVPRSHHPDPEEQQSDSSARSHGVKRSYDAYATTRPPPIPTIYPKPSLLTGLPQPYSTDHSPIHPAPSATLPPSKAAALAAAPLKSPVPLQTMPESRFSLHLRQNPRAARAGPDGKDRRTIDPPPVLQLLINDFDPHDSRDIAALKAHDWVVHAKLISTVTPHEDVTTIATHPERGNNSKVARLLLGTTVSSPFFCADDPDSDNAPEHPKTALADPPSPTASILKIPNRGRNAASGRPNAYKNFPGAFFIFPDLSIRKAGQYRLEFRLMKMTPDVLIPGRIVPTTSIVVSDIFNVVNAKDFDQVQPSTDLVKGLLDRGAGFPLKLKKGLREGQRKKGHGEDSDDDEDDGDGDGDEREDGRDEVADDNDD